MSKKVFVSGCYDMLHSGHVAFFKEASALGDLYVGIGSDATILELKNRKTVNVEQERLYMEGYPLCEGCVHQLGKWYHGLCGGCEGASSGYLLCEQ